MRGSSILTILTLASAALAGPVKRAAKFPFVGVNEAVAEFGQGRYPGVLNTDYRWPEFSAIDALLAEGLNTFRVAFAMERLAQESLAGPFDATYLRDMKATVAHITSQGAYAVLDPHNFGRYFGNIITSTADFAAFFDKLAREFVDDELVIFDTNNEYNTMPGQLVLDLNQAAVDAIRAAGATSQYIAVEGNSWSGAWTWTTNRGTDGLTNAETMSQLTDSEDKLLFQMHQYLDIDGSGTNTACVSETIGSERLQAATEWLRKENKRGLLGEVAGAVNPTCEAAVQDIFNFLVENNDVWDGALWWAAGPWWGNYMFSIEPSSGMAYDTYVPIIKDTLL